MNSLYVYPLSTSLKNSRDNELWKFKEYRDKYRYDLPLNTLKPENQDYDLFLCRTNIFWSVSLRIKLLIKKWIIEDNWEFKDFFDFIQHRSNNQCTIMTSKKDMSLIRWAITKTINILESTPNN